EKIYGEFIAKTPVGETQYFKLVASSNGEREAELASKYAIPFTLEEKDSTPFIETLLTSLLPFIIILGIFIFFMRQIQVGGGKALSFGKSRAKLMVEQKNRITFKDVAGVEEAKEELQEIIAFLKDPKRFTRLGGKIPKGVLLVGPPGTGKTLLARAVAGEAGVPFFSMSGSEFVEMFVGVGASRVRDLFDQGKKNAPCIIFIDEIDAVGRHRGAGLGGGHDEREQTLNQLLVEMDGFESNEGVILVSATNRPDVLDPALLRPGRFDRRVVVPTPDVKGREEILRVHARKTPLAKNVDLQVIARGTPGFSGADLANLVNEAALLASRREGDKLIMLDFERAKDKVLMGSERRSMIINDEEKRNTAYHEAGHTLVGKLIGGTDPIHKVTIIPRGAAMGLTQTLPIDDRYSLSKEYAENNIAFMMGGRIAEEFIFHHQTTGAGNDFEKATELARRMVCEWGMSEKLGPLTFGKKDQNIFLGREFDRAKDYSEKTAQEIDEEIKSFVLKGYARAKKIITEHRNELERLALALLEFETITGDDVNQLIQGVTVEELKKQKQILEEKGKESENIKPAVETESIKEAAKEKVKVHPALSTKKG
ncbi:MAG TPA: ATP-dependent zinc metalloprotease FtsH, partial [Bdellovibrionota bacterium]|nr:ATP-dependent zinc metalloprotease FtsH [Bdellovibrionota bacterium]